MSSLTVKQLIDILSMVDDKTLPVKVVTQDGVDELPFLRPIITKFNQHTRFEFIAINVVVSHE